MKVRIKGNSIRYRLTKSEVEKFSREGYLEESIQFPSAQFKYALKSKNGINDLEADLQNNCMYIYFPDALKEEWYSSDTVGYSRKLPLQNGDVLSILIEKDFVCLDDVEEDQSDNYPNPNLTC